MYASCVIRAFFGHNETAPCNLSNAWLAFVGVIEDLQRPALMKIHPRISFFLNSSTKRRSKREVFWSLVALEHFYLTPYYDL